jgi:hypothetical protein
MKKLVFENDNGISIVESTKPLDEVELFNLAKRVAKERPYSFVDIKDFPSSRYFRKSWYLEGDVVKVDIEKAKEEKLSIIRKLRNDKLKELDVEQLKGTDVSAQKQKLRDLPQETDLSKMNEEELENFLPEELK